MAFPIALGLRDKDLVADAVHIGKDCQLLRQKVGGFCGMAMEELLQDRSHFRGPGPAQNGIVGTARNQEGVFILYPFL